MNKSDLIEYLTYLQEFTDYEEAHILADKALLEFINDSEIKQAFDNLDKWYA